MKGKTAHYLVLQLFFLLSLNVAFSQTSEQKALEAKRAKLQNEIKEINK